MDSWIKTFSLVLGVGSVLIAEIAITARWTGWGISFIGLKRVLLALARLAPLIIGAAYGVGRWLYNKHAEHLTEAI